MKNYFKLNYEFDITEIHRKIALRLKHPGSAYITVADGVVLNIAHRDIKYRETVNESMFCICDSSYVPLYIRWIYGIRYSQYCGAQIFMDIVRSKKYKMCFLGTNTHILECLKQNLLPINPAVKDMFFYELPFCEVEEFDYQVIAQKIEQSGADIIWVALGAPKQDFFMNRLQKFLDHGIMLGVGAAFKFFSGVDERRAPKWMVNYHLEFIYRIFCEPKKQIKRCAWILYTLPSIICDEYCKKEKNKSSI